MLRSIMEQIGLLSIGDPASAASEPYEPTVLDVLVVKAMLQKAMRLPGELIDLVIDQAEYWPHTTASFDQQRDGELSVLGGSRSGRVQENHFVVRCAVAAQIICYPCAVTSRSLLPLCKISG